MTVMKGRGAKQPACIGALFRPTSPIISSWKINTATMIWSKACRHICTHDSSAELCKQVLVSAMQSVNTIIFVDASLYKQQCAAVPTTVKSQCLQDRVCNIRGSLVLTLLLKPRVGCCSDVTGSASQSVQHRGRGVSLTLPPLWNVSVKTYTIWYLPMSVMIRK